MTFNGIENAYLFNDDEHNKNRQNELNKFFDEQMLD